MMIIRRIYETKNKQLLLSLPTGKGLKKGDYVEVTLVKGKAEVKDNETQ